MSTTPAKSICRAAWLLLLSACVPVVATLAGTEPLGTTISLGLLVDVGEVADLPPALREEQGSGVPVRLEADWSRVEGPRGVHEWAAHESAIESLSAAGYEIILALTGSDRVGLGETEVDAQGGPRSLEAWVAFVRDAVGRFGDRVAIFEIGDEIADSGRAGSDLDPRLRSLVLKQSALAARAVVRARGWDDVLVAQAALGSGGLEAQKELWEQDLAAYFDVLPVKIDLWGQDASGTSRIEAVSRESLLHPPAPALLAYVVGGVGWDGPATAVRTLGQGAAAALFELPASQDGRREQAVWAGGLHRILSGRYEPASTGELRLDYAGGASPPGAAVYGRFFNGREFTTLIVFRAPQRAEGLAEPRLIVDTPVVRNARILDPVSGRSRRVGSDPEPAGGSGRAVRVGAASAALALSFERRAATPGFELPAEDLEIASTRGLTAEEIIARHQQVQRLQDDRVERWTARGRIDFHFKLAQSGASVDVSIDSNYFWERERDLEWEQTAYYINGNKVTWKNIPELPLIQPEKVITLPLDLTLDKTYDYRLVGAERVDGRPAYVLEFQPADPDSSLSLYRGRLWIDRASFVKLKTTVIQSRLEPPVLSNEEVDHYAEFAGPGGQAYSLFSRIDGQQAWNAAGRSFVVQRELTFSDYEINPARDEFEARRSQAYASRNQMLRDTDRGFRYLERQEDGSRVVKQEQDTSQLFLAGGAFKDQSIDGVIPLAGVNYFNYDLAGKNIQTNVLFGGVVAFVTASKPDLAGGRIDLTADVGLVAIKGDDKVFDRDAELIAERIESRSQRLALRLGIPVGQFIKLNLIGGATYRQYFESDESSDRIERLNENNASAVEFVLPQDHFEWNGSLVATFNRRGYAITASGLRATRSDWEPWGLHEVASGEAGLSDVETSFSRWGLTASKEWYLPKFQKLRGTVNYLDGSGLDRFSRYQFSFFGEDRLNGFSGSGVRFDEGWIARAGYAFNLFELIRLDAVVEGARVEQFESPVGSQTFSGIGLSGNFIGPWKTVINLNYGYALTSDIDELEGEQEFLLLVFKLF